MNARIPTLLSAWALLLTATVVRAAETTAYWVFSQQKNVGEREFSVTIAVSEKDGKLDGLVSHKCSGAGVKDTDSPVKKLEYDPKTKRIRFDILWNPPEEEWRESGTEATYTPEAVFEGELDSKKIRGKLTYLVANECVLKVGPEIALTNTLTDLEPAEKKAKGAKAGAQELRMLEVTGWEEISGGRVSIAGKGWGFVNGGTKFKHRGSATNIELTVENNAAATIRKCKSTMTEEIPSGKAVQIVGTGSFGTRDTKNPDFPVGVFTLAKVRRCQLVGVKAAPAK